MQEIYAGRAPAEAALKARRIIALPNRDSDERHIIQDERGLWRIVSGAAPTANNQILNAL